MRASRIAVAVIISSTLVYAEDFSLTQDGVGPITVHTTLSYEGKGERLIATAMNGSGERIPYVKLCVNAETKGCLFEMWTTAAWEAGATLNWNLTSVRHVQNLSQEVKIEAMNIGSSNAVQVRAIQPPTPASAAQTPAPAQQTAGREVLSNDAILKLARAGLGDNVITAMIDSQPGKYALDTDSVIALKQGGASDSVIAAMMGSRNATSSVGPAFVAGPTNTIATTAVSEPMILHDGTPVRMRLARNLSSADAKTSETIDFEVLDDVTVGDLAIIPRGAVAIGTVTEAEAKKRMARGGKLDVTIDYVRLVTGDKVALRGTKETAGGGHTGAMTAGIVVTALVVWPAAPFFLFMHGKDTVIPKGTEITAYVNGEVKLDRQKFAGK